MPATTQTKTTRAEKVKATLATLETGALTLARSDEYRAWLDHLARFHAYSVNNTLLIHLQHRHASRVAGFHRWKTLGRSVKKGEKGIKILAPIVVKKRDDDANDDDPGRAVTFFKVVHVFDISQTQGDALPEIAHKLTGMAPAGAYDALAAVARAERLSIEYADLGPSCNGSYSPDVRRIRIATGRSEAQRVKTLAHELAHHFTESDCDRPAAEIIAESVAYVVSDALGMDTSGYSFGYVASWTDGDAAPIRETIADVQKVAHRLLDALESANAARDGAPAPQPQPAPRPEPEPEPEPPAPAAAPVPARIANDPRVIVIDDRTPDPEPQPAPAPVAVPAPIPIPIDRVVAAAPAPAPVAPDPAPIANPPIVCDHADDHQLNKVCDPWRCDRCGATLHAHRDHASRLRAEHDKACKAKTGKRFRPYKGPGRNKAITDTLEPDEGLIRVLEHTPYGPGHFDRDAIVGVSAHWGSDAARAAGHALLVNLQGWQASPPRMVARAADAGLTVERTTDPGGKAISKTGGEFRRHEFKVTVAASVALAA